MSGKITRSNINSVIKNLQEISLQIDKNVDYTRIAKRIRTAIGKVAVKNDRNDIAPFHKVIMAEHKAVKIIQKRIELGIDPKEIGLFVKQWSNK